MPKGKTRKAVPPEIEANVLLKSRRRCCICFGLHHDSEEKLGQIAHLDRDPSNHAEDNLAFLCLNHHTVYDSRTRQHKNFTIREVKAFRVELHDYLRLFEQDNLRLFDQVAATQRAFVAMSHYPPGVHGWALEVPGMVYVSVDVEIKNWGKTPANVNEILFKPHVVGKQDSLPLTPDYTTDVPQSQLKPYLVAEGFIHYRQAFRLSAADATEIRAGGKNLYVYGFVDYTDQFKQRHRAGYGRLYKPWRDNPKHYDGGATGPAYRSRSNLVYMVEEQYNYDEPLARAG